LQAFQAKAVEFVARLPDEEFENDELDMDTLGPIDADELLAGRRLLARHLKSRWASGRALGEPSPR
jgi:hypothetical protein